jgi:hypothetical protein
MCTFFSTITGDFTCKLPTPSPSVVENFRAPLLVAGSSATLEDDGLEAKWVPRPPKNGDGSTEGQPTDGWTGKEEFDESWIFLGCP